MMTATSGITFLILLLGLWIQNSCLIQAFDISINHDDIVFRPMLSNRYREGHLRQDNTSDIILDCDDEYVNEEDVILTEEQKSSLVYQRNANDGIAVHWPDIGGFPNIPFAFVDSLVNQVKVHEAITQWEANTCLKFENVDTSYTGAHLQIKNHATDCNSYVGVASPTGQPLHLTERCEQKIGSVLSLLGHAIGLWHEQSRSDRNTHVKINHNNVVSGHMNHFDTFRVPYDYSSVMHDHGRVFTDNGRTTVAPHNPLYQGLLGQQKALSHMDKLIVNKMYDCSAKIIAAGMCSSDPCLNNGFLATDCSCLCPDGTSGANCEDVDTPYNVALLSPQTEIITTETTITSPNYPDAFPAGLKFTKWIKAPENHIVRLTFTDFDIYQRTPHYVTADTTENICWYDGLEIRTDDMHDGAWYCGTEISSGAFFRSTGNEMILYFKSNSFFKTGWSANITFERVYDTRDTEQSLMLKAASRSSTGLCTESESFGTFSILSPGFPTNYLLSAECVIQRFTFALMDYDLTINTFDLGPDGELVIENPYTSPLTLTGSIPADTLYHIPGANIVTTFTGDTTGSSSGSTGSGFDMEYTPVGLCCSELITVTSKINIGSTNFPKKHPADTYCEYLLEAPEGKRIKVKFLTVAVDCTTNYLAFNRDPTGSTPQFDAAISKVICGMAGRPDNIYSLSNRMGIYFYGEVTGKGFAISAQPVV